MYYVITKIVFPSCILHINTFRRIIIFVNCYGFVANVIGGLTLSLLNADEIKELIPEIGLRMKFTSVLSILVSF